MQFGKLDQIISLLQWICYRLSQTDSPYSQMSITDWLVTSSVDETPVIALFLMFSYGIVEAAEPRLV